MSRLQALLRLQAYRDALAAGDLDEASRLARQDPDEFTLEDARNDPEGDGLRRLGATIRRHLEVGEEGA